MRYFHSVYLTTTILYTWNVSHIMLTSVEYVLRAEFVSGVNDQNPLESK